MKDFLRTLGKAFAIVFGSMSALALVLSLFLLAVRPLLRPSPQSQLGAQPAAVSPQPEHGPWEKYAKPAGPASTSSQPAKGFAPVGSVCTCDKDGCFICKSGEFALDSCNPANTNCTQLDRKTGVKIDFLMSGSRISDRVYLNGIPYSDPLPIPAATGFGDIAPLLTLITMKVNVLTSGLDTHRLGSNTGGRSLEEVRKDIADVTELIAVNHLSRDLALGNDVLQHHYEKIFDRKLLV